MFHVTDLNAFARFVVHSLNIAAAVLVAGVLGSKPALATEWVKETRYFLISRDFQSFKIPASAAVFFKTKTLWGAEKPGAEIRDEARRVLAKSIKFVEDPTEAQYELHVRMEEYTDYATRSSNGSPARGFAMFAICVLPLKETTESCQNLTFYYFEDQARLTMFRRAAEAWLALIIR